MNHMKYRGFTRIYAVVLSVMMLMAMIPWSAGAETMHTVTFVTGGHIADVPSQQVADGACVANPGIAYDSQAADYSTTGLWFDWWFVEDPSPSFTTHDLGYTVEDGGKRYDFNLPLTRDLTLYAGYRAAQNYGVYDLTNSREYYGGKIRIVSPYNPNVSFTNGSGGTYANTGTRATVSIQVSEGYHFVGLSTSKSRDDIFTTDEEYAYIVKQRTSNYALFEVGEAVSKPRFSLASGEYNGTQKVEITCATDGAKIYYTTDGTDPSASSTEYTGEITVSASMKLKAVGVKEGYLNSNIAEADYTISAGQIQATVTGFSGPYDGSVHGITVNVTNPADGASVRYGTAAGAYSQSTSPTLTDAGTLTVFYQVTATGYEALTGSAAVTIDKADPAVTAPAANTGLSGTGQPQALVTAGTVTGGEMQYALGTDALTPPSSGWSTAVPIGTEEAQYYVWYKVVGDRNHNDTTPACITVTIGAAGQPVTPATPTVSGNIYKLNAKKKTATLVRPASKDIQTLKIPDTISVDGTKYKVTEIANNACKGLKKLKTLTIGKNVSKIGKNAFSNCKKLKTITIRTGSLTKKTIGKASFKGIDKKATFKVPKKMLDNYKSWFVSIGKAPKTARFKK